eukprot:112578-Amphidinium_carterae.1
MRQFVVQLVLLVSSPEDLCIDQTNKQESSKRLGKLLEQMAGYCQDTLSLRLPPKAFDVLDAMSVSLYEAFHQAMKRVSHLSDSTAAWEKTVFIQDHADSQKRRFHVIEYDASSHKPTERLACDTLNRAMVSLRWATLFGAAAVVYDQQAKSSLVLKEQLNSPDVARLMSAASAAFQEVGGLPREQSEPSSIAQTGMRPFSCLQNIAASGLSARVLPCEMFHQIIRFRHFVYTPTKWPRYLHCPKLLQLSHVTHVVVVPY